MGWMHGSTVSSMRPSPLFRPDPPASSHPGNPLSPATTRHDTAPQGRPGRHSLAASFQAVPPDLEMWRYCSTPRCTTESLCMSYIYRKWCGRGLGGVGKAKAYEGWNAWTMRQLGEQAALLAVRREINMWKPPALHDYGR